jgi:molybdopterin molybdotransferase
MTELPANPGCAAAGHDAPSLTLDDALQRLRAALRPVTAVESVPVRSALGRVLARDLTSDLDVPASANSAMDGYAIRAADREHGPLARVGSAFAGHPFEGIVGPGECVRIMTGGVLPEGADSVVMQEYCRADGDRVHVERWPRPGENVRAAGEDLRRGEVVLGTGYRLRAADLGVVASLGRAEVPVYRRLRVAFFSTGDELQSVGHVLEPGQVYDSNRYTLHGMLTRLQADIIDLGVVPDDPERIRGTLLDAAAAADVIVTSGGVSVGEADHVTRILAEVGDIGFWTVSIKPGRPLAFGHIGGAAFFGLPGNPVSAVVTFAQMVTPAMRHLGGEPPVTPLRIPARTTTALRKKPGRLEFQRGRLGRGEDGSLEVTSVGTQGSGILSSLSAADCFIVLPLERGRVEPGEWVVVEPFQAPLT